MRDLDETDLEIVRLLIEDARRPYSEIAERVGLSPPAVSDRVTRLEEQGVIRGFTLDVDRSKLRNRISVLIELRAVPDAVERVYESVAELDGTEHVFQLFDGRVLARANASAEDVNAWLRSGVEMGDVVEYDVALVARSDWNVDVTGADFALSCVVCDNPVESGGVTASFDGEIKAFCCPSCESRYVERYESHREAA